MFACVTNVDFFIYIYNMLLYTHFWPCPRRNENTMLRFCSIDPSGVVDRFCRRNEWLIKRSFLFRLVTERQKTGFSVNFFVRDVVLPIDAECSANHLPMTGIEHF